MIRVAKEINEYVPALPPYPGLNAYQGDYKPLFTGRRKDVENCTRVLTPFDTRLLMLHGRTGCGKSSFLLAGLIPHLEASDRSFEFVRDQKGSGSASLFVRSTQMPMVNLAYRLFDFANRSVTLPSVRGEQSVDLRDGLLGYTDQVDFAVDLGEDAERLLESLEKVATKLPQTLVLVIDQAEEVLTIEPGKSGEPFREKFFEFIARFLTKRFNVKLLVSLRTEYFGEFFARIVEALPDVPGLRSFQLKDLTEEQIVEAILYPTTLGKYPFSWEPDLPGIITRDVFKNSGSSPLPVVQIVCSRLYELTRKNGPWEIRKTDYDRLGGVEGQIDNYITETVERCCKEAGIWDAVLASQGALWRKVLFQQLVRSQADGTVTTDLKSEKTLFDAAGTEGCLGDRAAILEKLADEQSGKSRLLRYVKLQDHKGREFGAYSLAHDVIGLVLRRWNAGRESSNNLQRRALHWATGILTLGFAGAAIWSWLHKEDPNLMARATLALVFLVFFGMSFFPRIVDRFFLASEAFDSLTDALYKRAAALLLR
jgi:hypothetical protein